MDFTKLKIRGNFEFRNLKTEKNLLGEEVSIRGEVNAPNGTEQGSLLWRDCVWTMKGNMIYPAQNIMFDLILTD